MREIGKKLDVETLLEGSVRKAGNRLRITAQLVKVADGSHIWSDAYNRDLEDVFEIQEEISLAIVDNLKVKLLGKEKAAIVKRHTDNLEAYNLYLKGNYYSQMFTAEGFKKAFEYFEQSLQKDSNHSLAYVGLAYIPFISSFFGNVPPNEAYPKTKEYLKKALEIDNTLAEAYAALGLISMHYDWNWNAAEQELKQALQLNTNSAYVHLYYSWYLTHTDHHDEAIAEAKQSQELDPLSSYINAMLGNTYWFARQYDKAIEELQMTIAMNPSYFLAHFYLGHAYEGKSMIREAIREYEKAVDLSGGNPMMVSHLAYVYYELGKKEQAEKLIDSLKHRSKREYVPPMCFYLIHQVRGEQDLAFEWLERAYNEHDSFLLWILVTPFKQHSIPDEPRFNELMKKVGLIRRKT
jgi:tetratricopeptide (TPR) repeat protein